MRLHEADCHLEQERLSLATAARTLIAQTGYHRRDAELAEIERLLDKDETNT